MMDKDPAGRVPWLISKCLMCGKEYGRKPAPHLTKDEFSHGSCSPECTERMTAVMYGKEPRPQRKP